MARQTQFPTSPIQNPTAPYTIVSPPSLPAAVAFQNSCMSPSVCASGKRHRDDGSSEDEGNDDERLSSKRIAMPDVVFRIVMPSSEIGKMIGKEGVRIRKVREECRATVKIGDAISRHHDRVIIISSKENGDARSDAEYALMKIVGLILKDDESSKDILKGPIASNTIRLLVAETQASCLMGTCGQNIENIRKISGANVTVLTQLPLCAPAHISDRVVQISGDVPAVMKALEEISRVLRENPLQQVISISPPFNLFAFQAPQQYINHTTAANYVTLEMMISETVVGGLIGKGGSNVSRIRNQSGAAIKVHGRKGEQKHRQIHLAGSAQQVALAKQLVDEYLYSQVMQQVVGSQPS